MNKAIIITGTTASGKSKMAMEMAEGLIAKGTLAEIVSADSMQIYKGMDIGTAKASAEEQKKVKHHMIDIINPDEKFSVVKYRELALPIIKGLLEKGVVPIICGGTGFYIDSLIYTLKYEGYEEKDYPSACKPSDEFPYEMTVLIPKNDDERKLLYEKINQRVDEMFDKGLVGEVQNLYKKYPSPPSAIHTAIGYKEIIAYLNGEISLDESKDLIKKSTRHYAKRQITWMKKYV